MSFVTSDQIITSNLFPLIYALDTPTITYEPIIYDAYDSYNLPLTASIDPAYVTGDQKYEYRYTNSNGVDVVLRGTYNDVMSTVDVLNTYPPKKTDCADKKEYFDLYGAKSKPSVSTVPEIGSINKGKYINIVQDGKTFSGAGALIMVVEDSKPLIEAKFALFRSTFNGEYQDLGGNIDKLSPGTNPDKNTLFNTAKKETEEESMKLFNLSNQSPHFIDVESTTDGTWYRVFLYVFKIDNINKLSTLYVHNKSLILSDYALAFSDAYKETDKLDLFDYRKFIDSLKNHSDFQTTTGMFVKVRGRTRKLIDLFEQQGIFTKIINNNLLSTPTIKLDTAGTSFNTISLN